MPAGKRGGSNPPAMTGRRRGQAAPPARHGRLRAGPLATWSGRARRRRAQPSPAQAEAEAAGPAAARERGSEGPGPLLRPEDELVQRLAAVQLRQAGAVSGPEVHRPGAGHPGRGEPLARRRHPRLQRG